MSKKLYRVTISSTIYIVEESLEAAEEEALSITSIGDENLVNVHAQAFSYEALLKQLEFDGWSSALPYGKNSEDLTCKEFLLRQIEEERID